MSFNNFSLKLTRYLPPELSNKLSLEALKLIYNLNLLESLFKKTKKNPLTDNFLGINFPNKIGVAGGLDKNGKYFHVLDRLGFGFVEVGTLTLKPQLGNPKPRVQRFYNQNAIINSLGFNNVGASKALKNIEKNKENFKGILGISLGKGKEIPNEKAYEDYLHLMDYFKDVADYFAINISSPNTESLRKLTLDDYFNKLIDEIINKKDQISIGSNKKPIVIKISPDESIFNLEKIVSYCSSKGVDGLILTNTSLNHNYNLPGGISGEPLKQKALESLKFVRSIVGEDLTIISSGGLMNKEDVIERFKSKADLIQLYTGFVFKGNDLLQECLEISST